jgi:hypothetical protein
MLQALMDLIERQFAQLPDERKASPNRKYSVRDAALSAFAVFMMQTSTSESLSNNSADIRTKPLIRVSAPPPLSPNSNLRATEPYVNTAPLLSSFTLFR